MEIKLKKLVNNRIIKVRAIAEIKEINPKKDLKKPENEKVEICFKGQSSSGIIEMKKEEAKNLIKLLQSKTKKN